VLLDGEPVQLRFVPTCKWGNWREIASEELSMNRSAMESAMCFCQPAVHYAHSWHSSHTIWLWGILQNFRCRQVATCKHHSGFCSLCQFTCTMRKNAHHEEAWSMTCEFQTAGMFSQPSIGKGALFFLRVSVKGLWPNLFAQDCQFKALSIDQLWISVTIVLGGCST